MNVVLREDVPKLGSRGDVVSVAAGYARNFLVPRGLAIMASRGAVKEADAMRRARDSKVQRSIDAAKVQANAIEALRLQIAHRRRRWQVVRIGHRGRYRNGRFRSSRFRN